MGVLRMPEVEAEASQFMRRTVESYDSWPMQLTLGPGVHRVGMFAGDATLSITTDEGTFTGYGRMELLVSGGTVTLNASPAGSVTVSVQSLGHG